MKKTPSGDHAKSYISAPVDDLHMCFTRQVSLSSAFSSPSAVPGISEGTQSRTLPSSPADASVSPATSQIHRLIGRY